MLMKIVITGANGSFGGAMTRYFSKKGHTVIACGRQAQPPERLLDFATYHQLDVTKSFALPEGDVLIHAAANSDDKAKMKELYGPNVRGTKNIVLASQSFNKFIFISSSSVYLPEELPISEEMAGQQNNKKLSPYGLSKLQSEAVVRENSKHESCFILRARSFYGAGDTKIVPRILKLVKKDVFTRPGSLEINLSMTHYDNMGHAIECCINSDLKGIRTYNVSDDKEYLMIDVLRNYFESIYGDKLKEKEVKIALLNVLAFFRIGGFTPLLVRALTQNMVLDITKFKKELNYVPVTDFYQSLEETAMWIKSVDGPEALRYPEKELCWK